MSENTNNPVTPETLQEVFGDILARANKEEALLLTSIAGHTAIQEARAAAACGDALGYYNAIALRWQRVQRALIVSARPNASWEEQFLFFHYEFILAHFRGLIERHEGISCCVDKAHEILWRLGRYQTTGEEIWFEETNPRDYRYPTRVFTTHAEILVFYNGLMDLYFGRPERYLAALRGIEERLQALPPESTPCP